MSLQETFDNSMVCSISTGMVLKWIPVYKINYMVTVFTMAFQ